MFVAVCHERNAPNKHAMVGGSDPQTCLGYL